MADSAQGIGQALMEDVVYDRESGQPLAGSFMDYAMPRADDLPSFVSELDESQPCTHNPLGAKGCGGVGLDRRAGGAGRRGAGRAFALRGGGYRDAADRRARMAGDGRGARRLRLTPPRAYHRSCPRGR